jgi:hypothetical protein
MKIHRTTLVTALSLGVLLGPSAAFAGTLQLRDEAGLFDEAAVRALRSEAERQPFDLRVWTTARFTDRWALDRATAAQVVAPDVLAVTLDPAHRRTSVHVGVGLRIPTTRYRALGDAGDESFRAGRWGDGVVAIARTAGQWSAADGAAGRSEGVGFPWGLVFFGAGLVAVIALTTRWIRRRQQEPVAFRGDAYRTPYVPHEPPPPAGYGPEYGPGHYPPSGGGGVGSHIAAAGLGGLAGYALGSALSDHHGHGGAEHHPADTNAGDGGYDDGGSTSGWDDGGGGGGDFGGGDAGGGDFGGGGGDW